MNVQAYLVDADYPRVNHPLPLPPGREPRQPDLQFTVEVDVYGVAVPAPPPEFFAIPDYRELERLLLQPIMQAVEAAL